MNIVLIYIYVKHYTENFVLFSFRTLEDNWQVIRDEGISVLSKKAQDGFRPESENLQDKGDWKQFELFSRGRKITANCINANKTCELIEKFPAAAGCKRGQVRFEKFLSLLSRLFQLI